MFRFVTLALVLGLSLGYEAAAAQPQFFKLEGARDFLAGELDGFSVDSEGHLRAAPRTELVQDTEAPYVWCLADDGKGRLFVGTGNEGRVFVVQDGQARLFFDAPELEVNALAFRDGQLYVATSPDGKVYRVDAQGHSEDFFDPAERYIWALAFDRTGQLLIATGGEAKLYRVDPERKSVVLLSSPETHFTALLVDSKGEVFVGTSPGGIVYRVDADGKAFALVDTGYREIKALVEDSKGGVVAAALDATREVPPAAPTPAATATASSGTEVTVSETYMVPVFPTTSAPPASTGARPGAKGAVLRLFQGDVETLWSSNDDAPHALLAQDEGVLIGTGDKGRLFRVGLDQRFSSLGQLPGEQATALLRNREGGLILASSNPGRVHRQAAAPAGSATFTSAVKDTEAISTFGRMAAEARLEPGVRIELSTRSGNTQTPDATWSDWSQSASDGAGQKATSPKARFVQLRVRLVPGPGQGGHSSVDSVGLAYLQRNQRPQVLSATVHPPGEVFQKPLSSSGEIEVLGLDTVEPADARTQAARAGQPPAMSFSRKLYQRGLQTLSWKAEDPNGDALTYDVFYRGAAETRFRLLRRGLTDTVYAWDTMSLPNGRYVVKVVARDGSANPEALALSGERESVAFDVDNTPPRVELELASREPARVRARVQDDASAVRRAEFSVDGQRWQEVYPTDGINDAREEAYEISPGAALSGPGPHVLVVRATDLLGNVASARIEIP